MGAPNEYPLMIVCPDYTYRHLRDEGAIYGLRSGFGFVDKLDVERFGWIVQPMDDLDQDEETLNL